MIDEGWVLFVQILYHIISVLYPKVDMLTSKTHLLIELDYLDSSAMQLKRKRNAAEARATAHCVVH